MQTVTVTGPVLPGTPTPSPSSEGSGEQPAMKRDIDLLSTYLILWALQSLVTITRYLHAAYWSQGYSCHHAATMVLVGTAATRSCSSLHRPRYPGDASTRHLLGVHCRANQQKCCWS